MQELIKVRTQEIGADSVNSVDARELYITLEIKKPFADWIRHQIKTLDLDENVDYITFSQKVKAGRGTATRKEYIITADTAEHIAMASRTSKGKEVRKFFILIKKEYLKSIESNKAKIAGGYKSQITQKNSKIKELEAKVLLLESGLDKKVDYRLKAKALYPVILDKIDQIENEFAKEFSGQSLQVFGAKLDE